MGSMNLRLVARMLSLIALLIGVAMGFSLPWAIPVLGHHTFSFEGTAVETRGAIGLTVSMLVSFAVAGALKVYGGKAPARLFRREAMAVVGLSWVMATVLGALPYVLSGTARGPAVRMFGPDVAIMGVNRGWRFWIEWQPLAPLKDPEHYRLVEAIVQAGGIGLTREQLESATGIEEIDQAFRDVRATSERWQWVLIGPDEEGTGDRREKNFRVRWVRMSLIDALFESQSGFSTTGASVISDLEDSYFVPHCILFWRSSTHFLGGLGIIVLFVAVLGQGSAGKTLMRTEMPGPTKEGSTERMQHTAWRFVWVYCGLNALMTLVLMGCGMNLFDALCHAFGTLATGGFSTYNTSLAAFGQHLGPGAGMVIEYVVIIFMMIGGTNFTLLYLTAIGQPFRLSGDTEWRTYLVFIGLFTLAIIGFGLVANDFANLRDAVRHSLFAVVSVMTTTGFVTEDFDRWNNFARGALLLLMFVGGCAGSTGGGMKVIRHVLFLKILRLEVERSFHPSVVRLLRLGGKAVEDQDLRRQVLVYFGLTFFLFAFSWLAIVTLETESTWGGTADHKLVDSASAVATTLNNVGPGLGTCGPTQNFGHFGPISKLLFVWLMMLGRLELFPILVLMIPAFWRQR